MAYKKASETVAPPVPDFELSREVQSAFQTSLTSTDELIGATQNDQTSLIREGAEAIATSKQASRRLSTRLAGR